jgi:phage recombination protein Bet
MVGMVTVPPAAERQGVIQWAATTFGVDAGKVMSILRSTCFKVKANEAEATDSEVAALLVVSRQFGLNPFLKQIYAFRARDGGIVPIVGVDGWAAIVSEDKRCDGWAFTECEDTVKSNAHDVPKWIECTIFRNDRKHPHTVRERFSEVKRDTQPWSLTPARMLRHRAFMQCARMALAFTGLYDEDEGRIVADGLTGTVIQDHAETRREDPPPPERSRTQGLAADLAKKAQDATDVIDVIDPDTGEIGDSGTEAVDFIPLIETMTQETAQGVLTAMMKLPDNDQRKALLQTWNTKINALTKPAEPTPAAVEPAPARKGKGKPPPPPAEEKPTQPDLMPPAKPDPNSKPKGNAELQADVIAQMKATETKDELVEVATRANEYEWPPELLDALNSSYIAHEEFLKKASKKNPF